MKKVGCITFHASHNYGSVLQAYALQEYIKKNFSDVDYKIINLRTKRQKDMYAIFPKGASLKYRVFILLNYFAFAKKYNRFEYFINNKLNVTKEFSEENLTEEDFNFDVYISGGDQIWNLIPLDFSWIFYLPFVKKAKKISYAVSIGPKMLSFTEDEKKKVKEYVDSYDSVSCREKESIEQLQKITDRNISQNIDPVLLLDKKDWQKLVGERLEKKSYIFLYILDGDAEAYSFAKRLSKLTHKKVIISKPICKKDVFYFSNRFDCGPIEFLNYVYYADCVISTSFHGCVFASIFEISLFTLNAEKDNRRKNFLSKYNLNERNVDFSVSDEKLKKLLESCDYSDFKSKILEERKVSFEYLAGGLK